MKLLWHRELYRDERFFSAFPSVGTLPDGDVLLAFRRAPDHRWMFGEHTVRDFESVDHWHFRSHIAMQRFGHDLNAKGDVFSLPAHPEAADQDANLFLTKSGRVIQYGFLWYPITSSAMKRLNMLGLSVSRQVGEGEGYLFWGGYTRFSDDLGQTWSDHRMMPTDEQTHPSPFRDHPGGSAFRGRMIELPDGRLMLAGYEGGLSGSDYCALRFYMSEDDGVSWQVRPDIVSMRDIHLQEPALARWPNDKITIFNRTAGNRDRLITATSKDGGLTFGKPTTVAVTGHPYDPLVLPDGRLFLVYGYRHAPMGVRARFVEPGQAIADAREYILRDDSPSRDTGYPSATLLADGNILVAYYNIDKRGVRGIEATAVSIG